MPVTNYTWASNDPFICLILYCMVFHVCLPSVKPSVTIPEQVLVNFSALQSLPRTCLGGEHCCNRDNGPCSLGKVNIPITNHNDLYILPILTSRETVMRTGTVKDSSSVARTTARQSRALQGRKRPDSASWKI